MNTEPDPSDAEAQAAHAALFKRVSDHLALTAGKLTRLSDSPKLTPVDVADLFLATGLNVLLVEQGDAAVVARLREIAATIEAGAPVAN